MQQTLALPSNMAMESRLLEANMSPVCLENWILNKPMMRFSAFFWRFYHEKHDFIMI